MDSFYFDGIYNSAEKCFICGMELTDLNKSQEHIFPLWLLKDFEILDEKLTLSNGSLIPYRQLKIPCCKICNSGILSKNEQKIKEGLEGGYDSFVEIEDLVVVSWMSKIVLGVLLKENHIKKDRSNPLSGPIITNDSLKKYRNLILLSRNPKYNTIHLNRIYSLFKFKIIPSEADKNFFYATNFDFGFIFIKLKDIALLLYYDGNYIEKLYTSDEVRKSTLTKGITYEELLVELGKITYHSYLSNYDPVFQYMGNVETGTIDHIINLSHYIPEPDPFNKVECNILLKYFLKFYGNFIVEE